ncbi:hypothetical protein PYW07_016435 [Mythimna separata]|uniref:BED-type domain-containing protein n=1 Tax=Mythimna separata TaxID=271217 RepID=A0AAD8DS44_MYTSE|nr:hypothetical protein PYW07_016435 [Mythimna separata]
MKCNLCEVNLKTDEKSLDLLYHLKGEHKDIYDLHKDNPEATVGFRIEFLHLNVLKDDEEAKTQPVILGEVCETTTETIAEKEEEINVKSDEANLHFVLLDEKAQKKSRRESAGPRKRSWVWKYFDKLSNIIYRCKLCHVVLSIKGCNSNNMNRHVRSRHPTVFKSEVAKRDKGDSVHMLTSETDTPYAIKTEEIYASDRDFEEITADSPTQKLRRSWIWSYFDRVSTTQARCKLCERHICHGGNATGNMNRHLKMIHHKTAVNMPGDMSWVWKVFEAVDNDFYSCKICQYKCLKCSDVDKDMNAILTHLKLEHGVISGDQIITGADVENEETC